MTRPLATNTVISLSVCVFVTVDDVTRWPGRRVPTREALDGTLSSASPPSHLLLTRLLETNSVLPNHSASCGPVSCRISVARHRRPVYVAHEALVPARRYVRVVPHNLARSTAGLKFTTFLLGDDSLLQRHCASPLRILHRSIDVLVSVATPLCLSPGKSLF